jgi:hypothetical protein
MVQTEICQFGGTICCESQSLAKDRKDKLLAPEIPQTNGIMISDNYSL